MSVAVRPCLLLALLCPCALAIPQGGGAQQIDAVSPHRPEAAGVAGCSLLLPGWGQKTLGQRRWIGYALVEAALWAFWIDRRAGGADFRGQYRDLAWNQSRVRSGPRVDGDWEYYERLSNWTRSGGFDTDAEAPGIQPEEDPTTYNGWIWGLARGLFFSTGQPATPDDPAYARALAYYEERAYATAYLWDWTGKEPQLNEFKDLIDRSDQRFRQATAAMGAVIANHLLSSADGFLSSKASRPMGIRMMPDPFAGGSRWTMTLHVGGVRWAAAVALPRPASSKRWPARSEAR